MSVFGTSKTDTKTDELEEKIDGIKTGDTKKNEETQNEAVRELTDVLDDAQAGIRKQVLKVTNNKTEKIWMRSDWDDSVEQLEQLIDEHGEDSYSNPNVRPGTSKTTIFKQAIDNGNDEYAKILIKPPEFDPNALATRPDADRPETQFHHTLSRGRDKLALAMLEEWGDEIDLERTSTFKRSSNEKTERSYTPLNEAIRCDASPAVVHKLIELGADINQPVDVDRPVDHNTDEYELESMAASFHKTPLQQVMEKIDSRLDIDEMDEVPDDLLKQAKLLLTQDDLEIEQLLDQNGGPGKELGKRVIDQCKGVELDFDEMD